MNFSIEITNPAHLSAIKAAREAHNASLPKDSTDTIDTDQAYLDDRFNGMAASCLDSWAGQYDTDVTKIDAEIAVLQDRKAAIEAKPGKLTRRK